jgi:hypothetical protein
MDERLLQVPRISRRIKLIDLFTSRFPSGRTDKIPQCACAHRPSPSTEVRTVWAPLTFKFGEGGTETVKNDEAKPWNGVAGGRDEASRKRRRQQVACLWPVPLSASRAQAHSRHFARALGQAAVRGGWTRVHGVSPISLLPPSPVIQAIWTCDRIGDDELDAADWLSGSVLCCGL